MPRYCSSPLPSNGCLPANGNCDKYWGLLRGFPGAGELGGVGVLWAGPQKALTPSLIPPTPPLFRLFLRQDLGLYDSLVQDPRARDLEARCF